MKKRALWITLASVLIVTAAIYGWISYYNTSKARLWEEKKAELAADDIFTGRDYIFARRIPAESNLWEAPITAGLLLAETSTEAESVGVLRPLITGRIKVTYGRRLGEETKMEVVEVPKEFPIQGSIEEKLELWIAPMLPALELWLAELVAHPDSQVMHVEDGKMLNAIELPEVKSAIKLAHNLSAVALAEVKSGQTSRAMNQLCLLLRLGDGFLDQPFLLDGLLGTAIISVSLESIYLGIKIEAWDEAQLSELNQRLERINLLKSLRISMNGELCNAIDLIEFSQFKNLNHAFPADASNHWLRVVKLLPSGVFNSIKLDLADVYHTYFIGPLDPGGSKFDISRLKGNPVTKDPRLNSRSLSGLLLKIMTPVLSGTFFKAFNTDMDIKFTRIAIALERYKLRYQKYPTDLSALVPDFLAAIPVDWAYQKAPSYELTSAGRYRIWHPGWDGNDEGGIPSKKPDQKKGDLVWTFEPIKPLP